MKANKLIARFLETLDTLDKSGKRVPGLILSAPGFGKTSTIRKWCEYKDYDLVTLIPSQQASDDILGLQSMVDGKLVRLTPSWYNKLKKQYEEDHKRICLFIDELSAVDSWTQGPLLDLIFSHSLGEEKLPDDCFIVAAGNYASDLNNAFKMSSPIVNRFVLLNLDPSDFNLVDFLNDDFDKVHTKEQIEEYFELKADEKIAYDSKKICNFIENSGEVNFSNGNYTELPGIGLCGFTSIRSLGYALQFMQVYTATYSDRLWMRVVGDTLGTSKKREGKPLRTVLEAKEQDFLKTDDDDIKDVNFGRYCEEIIKTETITIEEIKKLEKIINNLSPRDLTNNDLKQWTTLASAFSNLPEVKTLNSRLIEKISRF